MLANAGPEGKTNNPYFLNINEILEVLRFKKLIFLNCICLITQINIDKFKVIYIKNYFFISSVNSIFFVKIKIN